MNETGTLPEFPKFRILAIEDKTLLDPLFKRLQPQVSELTFTNLYVWNEAEPVQLSILRGTVLILRKRISDGRKVFFPPPARESVSATVKLIREAAEESFLEIPFYGLNAPEANKLSKEDYQVQADRDNWDYVYLTSDLAELPGDKYHSKRNFITRCLSTYECEYRKIDARVVGDCLRLQTQWCDLRKCDSVPSLEAENKAIKEIFANYQSLSVSGGAIYVDDKLEAFTLAEPLNDETAVIHFEKANPEIIGLYQLINQWFCQNELRKFIYVNREQDLGVPGLRKAKQSYHPHHMVEKYLAFAR